MNILFVDLEREWRGGQNQAFLALRGMHDEGHEIVLVAPNGAPLAERIAQLGGIAVRRVSMIGMRICGALAIRKLLRKKKFDLIHVNEPHALTAAWFARAHRKLPIALSRRIGFPLKKTWIARARYGSLTKFLANCKDVEQSLVRSGVIPTKIAIVNEGVEVPAKTSQKEREDARAKWGIKKEEFLFGCVGVFVPEKGQRHLIGALAILRKQFPQARLILAGDGKCRSDLEALAREVSVSNDVIFTGFLRDVGPVYAAMDAFVFPSEFEGLGTALQSAMALALPCVSTARGGLAEVVDGERTVLVVEPGAKEFASAMQRLIADEHLRRRLGDAARSEIQEKFSDTRMVKRTIEVYHEVCAAR
jgi:glycosyltransferase involved in cell wall biosynthesis